MSAGLSATAAPTAGRARPQAPWLAAVQPHLDAVSAACAAGATVVQALNARLQALAPLQRPQLAAGALRFVPQATLPAGEAYEAFIHRTASVPTRDNAHDLFNGLQWLARPVLKRRLNALQAADMAARGIGATRGPLRDALTLFDENGALLAAPPALAAALRQRDWVALFGRLRPQWAQARLHIVGHALLEQLQAAPRKGLSAHVLVWDDPLADTAARAAAMAPDDWAAKPFCPLPVLGVPGWWPAQDAGFYADAAVFRPPRGATPTQAGKKPSIDR